MKDLIFSTILFSALIIIIICNSFFIRSNADAIKNSVAALPSISAPECKSEIECLRAEWQSFKRLARFSLNYSELNKIECFIEELDCHRRLGNENDFEHTKVMMINILSEIERMEKPTADGIF